MVIPKNWEYDLVKSADAIPSRVVEVKAIWKGQNSTIKAQAIWSPSHTQSPVFQKLSGVNSEGLARFRKCLEGARFFSLNADLIAKEVPLRPSIELGPNGQDLAGVLDQLRDEAPERFDALNQELGRWLPEFDRILFETPQQGMRAISLRTRAGGHTIKAENLSQGTLVALAILTLAYLPHPPPLVCLEEPDHGLHPRLLRDVRDAIYRLAYPENFGEKREPVQVIATTHNPYFLDLFKDHPEEIVIAEKIGLEARFSRLSDRPDLNEILGEAHLGDVWYSGVLGGVPAGT